MSIGRGMWIIGAVLAVAVTAGCGDGASSTSGATSSTSSAAAIPPVLGASTMAGAGSTVESLTVDGKTANYVLHVPAGVSGALPAVIVLHGGNGSGTQIETVSGMSAVADSSGFVAAYPDATTPSAIKALIAELVSQHGVDPARIYLSGISHGGIDTQVAACALSGQLAGIAVLSAGLPTQLESQCPIAKPLPVILIHGTADPVVPYAGGTVNSPNATERGNATVLLSAVDTLKFWRGKDGCTGDTTTAPAPGTDDTVTLTTGPACTDGVQAQLYSVQGGGHTWPGGSTTQQQYSSTLGPLNTTFDASKTIWDFFATQAH
ncbi:alpha/beta hydrolase family esterase [Nocardia concava]|uniref:alpha/beta hydrolase family esterase n=1 Tax=Nocardia concava TaxID=257281 RepID=UPI000A01A97C|nr:hypothetical protein [Nocardia concava]